MQKLMVVSLSTMNGKAVYRTIVTVSDDAPFRNPCIKFRHALYMAIRKMTHMVDVQWIPKYTMCYGIGYIQSPARGRYAQLFRVNVREI